MYPPSLYHKFAGDTKYFKFRQISHYLSQCLSENLSTKYRDLENFPKNLGSNEL